METTDFCSYELSKRLKGCGFNEPCDHYYNGHGNLNRYADTDRINRNTNGHHTPSCSAPTLAHAQKWLREEKGIDVLVWNCACGYGWEISKADPQSRGTTLEFYDDNGEDRDSGMWLTYENALSAGINVALQLLDNEKQMTI